MALRNLLDAAMTTGGMQQQERVVLPGANGRGVEHALAVAGTAVMNHHAAPLSNTYTVVDLRRFEKSPIVNTEAVSVRQFHDLADLREDDGCERHGRRADVDRVEVVAHAEHRDARVPAVHDLAEHERSEGDERAEQAVPQEGLAHDLAGEQGLVGVARRTGP